MAVGLNLNLSIKMGLNMILVGFNLILNVRMYMKPYVGIYMTRIVHVHVTPNVRINMTPHVRTYMTTNLWLKVSNVPFSWIT